MGIIELLKSYKKIRDAEVERFGEHVIEPPSESFEQIRTLEYDFFRPISPMLGKRFEFCSAWKNAYLNHDWLSNQEINNWKENKTFREWLKLRKENYSYQGQPFMEYPMKNIAIFSIDPYEPEETYLVWDDGIIEPKIWHYFEADFYTFNNFERFLLYINNIIDDEDTIRTFI